MALLSPESRSSLPSASTHSPLLSLPYDILSLIAAHTVPSHSLISYRCPHRHALFPYPSSATHLHPTCGAGPGWSCLLEPPCPPDPQPLAILRAHPILHDPASRALRRRGAFEVEIRAGRVFFADAAGSEAETKLETFAFASARRVQISVWMDKGWEAGLFRATQALGGKALREVAVVLVPPPPDSDGVTGEALLSAVEAAAETAVDARDLEGEASREAAGLAEMLAPLRGAHGGLVGVADIRVWDVEGEGVSVVLARLSPGSGPDGEERVEFGEWDNAFRWMITRAEAVKSGWQEEGKT